MTCTMLGLGLWLAIPCVRAGAQVEPPLVRNRPPTVTVHALDLPNLPSAATAPMLLTTAISADGGTLMISLMDPAAASFGGWTADPTATWIHDGARGETRELHIERSGKPWRLVGRSALSADGRFVASICAPDLGPMPAWKPGMQPVGPSPPRTIALVELASGGTRFIELDAIGCKAPLAPLDPLQLSADGGRLAIPTTPDFGNGVDHGWTMLWSPTDEALKVAALDDAYYGLLGPQLTGDGRWLIADAFAKDSSHPAGLFRIEVATGASSLVSIAPDGSGLTASMRDHAMDASGQHVAFVARTTPGDGGEPRPAVFVRDVAAGTTICVSVSSEGGPANGDSRSSAFSGDGEHVAFVSTASNLVAPEDDEQPDLFVRELSSGRVVQVPLEVGMSAEESRTICLPALCADGRRVLFVVGTGSSMTQVMFADIEWHADQATEKH